MQSTWNRSPSSCSLEPTTSATRPPMPASTSSKISVLVPRRRRAGSESPSVFSASMTRDNSPPDTIRASGRRSSPGFGETKNSAWSSPRSLHADSAKLAVVETDLETRPRHREIPKERFQIARELDRRRRRVRESCRALRQEVRRQPRRAPRCRSSPARRAPRQQVALPRQRVRPCRSRPAASDRTSASVARAGRADPRPPAAGPATRRRRPRRLGGRMRDPRAAI